MLCCLNDYPHFITLVWTLPVPAVPAVPAVATCTASHVPEAAVPAELAAVPAELAELAETM